MKKAKTIAIASVLATTLLSAGSVLAQGANSQGTTGGTPGMGQGMMNSGGTMQGSGTGPQGMMGGGMMQGSGTGPQGMMGGGMMQGSGKGHGMMKGYGKGHGKGHGMMGGGMMGGGMMMGHGGYGAHHQSIDRNLSPDDVAKVLNGHLAWVGHKRLKAGDVKKQDDGSLIADINTVDDSLVFRVEVDPKTGAMHHVQE